MKAYDRVGSMRRKRTGEKLPLIASRKKAYSDMTKSKMKILANDAVKDIKPSLENTVSKIIFRIFTLLSSQ